MRKPAALLLLCWFSAILNVAGCKPNQPNPDPPVVPRSSTTPAIRTSAGSIQQADLSDPAQPIVNANPISLSGARNEWTNLAVRLAVPSAAGYSVRFNAPKAGDGAAAIPLAGVEAFQVLPAPVDMNRAGYVRHTGQSTATRSVPRALVPLRQSATGQISLASLRDPDHPAGPVAAASAVTTYLWFDVYIPATAPAGQYAGSIELVRDGAAGGPTATLPLQLTVYNFNLPNERHLQLVGRLEWDRLEKLHPERFETFTPNWVNRRDVKYADTVATLDTYMALAQKNRVALVIPALRPTTKWPAGAPPTLEWDDFDSLVSPWFSGQQFADHTALRYWPLPSAEMLDRYDRKSQLDYWSQASGHFDQNKWLGISPVSVERPAASVLTSADERELSIEASEILRTHPRVKVLLPLRDDQIQLASSENPALIDPSMTNRLMAASAGLISSSPAQPWPGGAARPDHWLRADRPGLIPYAGGGSDERDVRVWAWLAFLRHVTTYGRDSANRTENFVLWGNALPNSSSPNEPAAPNELVWFYPGSWFGVDQPVATLQLKWLRKAEQEYEYLRLARERGEVINALQMARLITRPVEIAPGQSADSLYSLMSTTTEAAVWEQARRLLADTILLHQPGQAADERTQQDLYVQTLQWALPRERPMMLARSADWSLNTVANRPGERGTWVDLKLGLDIYNPSENAPEENRLGWSQVPAGWQIQPHELEIPRLSTFHVTRTQLEQKFNLDQLSLAARQPIELQFVEGLQRNASTVRFILPVAASDRREGRLSLDGNLEEWVDGEAIADGPLVRMFDRPALQKQKLELAATPTRLFSAWARENFYVAFDLAGLSARDSTSTRNFIDYQQGRVWGEDLCEILIQPIDSQNQIGPLLHIVCKPNGAIIAERRPGGRPTGDWLPIEGAAVRYAAQTPTGAWRGEIAIPWSLISGQGGGVPTLLRFNFTQHRVSTGESATWAGPVDSGRDEAFMGLLYLRSAALPVPGAR